MVRQKEFMKDRSVRDISQCVEQARLLANRLADIRQPEHRLQRAFTSLAGDESVGLVAYMIWRSRANQP
jgi:hypothetical protein